MSSEAIFIRCAFFGVATKKRHLINVITAIHHAVVLTDCISDAIR